MNQQQTIKMCTLFGWNIDKVNHMHYLKERFLNMQSGDYTCIGGRTVEKTASGYLLNDLTTKYRTSSAWNAVCFISFCKNFDLDGDVTYV